MALQNWNTVEYLPSSSFYHTYTRRIGVKNVPFIRGVHKAPLDYQADFYSAVFKQLRGSYRVSIGSSNPIVRYNDFLGTNNTSGIGKARNRLVNRALSRFNDKIKPASADLGATFAESRSSLDMVAARSMQIWTAYRHLRKGDFREFAKTLGIASKKQKKKHRNQPKWKTARESSGIWLEYWFGWSPLLGEIYSVVDVMSKEFPTVKFVGGASEKYGESYYGSPNFFWDLDFKLTVRVGAEIAISNPNLFLANQLGLVNPASVAWELVPFSFIADWFVNIGDYINSLTEYVGLSVTNSYHSYRIYGTFQEYRGNTWDAQSFTEGVADGFRRLPGLPSVTLTTKPFRGFSTTRGATAIALVVALFAPKRSKS